MVEAAVEILAVNFPIFYVGPKYCSELDALDAQDNETDESVLFDCNADNEATLDKGAYSRYKI